MTDQLSMFEPTGADVLMLAHKHQKDADRARSLFESLNVQGWHSAASVVYRNVDRSENLAAEMFMLAEVEALGGVSQ